MPVLDQLEPKKVFQFFEEMTRIPHGTFDTKRISDYCVEFAKERGLAGAIEEPSSYFMKHPPVQHVDDQCRAMLEDFIAGK